MLKCLVWDLDHTLWEGTLAEGDKLVITEEKMALILKLDSMGILQSIASRNDFTAAMEQLERFHIKEYFLYPQCGYQSKADSIRKIAESLNIGIDAIGFMDDNEFELSEIAFFLPEVKLYDVEKDWKKLEEDLSYLDQKPTYESAHRREMMIARQQRETEREEFTGTRNDFLRACNMKLTIRYAKLEDSKRVCELASRSNQLNSLTEEVNPAFYETFLNKGQHIIIVTELEDRFGYHGIVGVCFLELINKVLFMKQFCISCRTEGRGISAVFLSEVIQSLQGKYKDVQEISCNYNMTLRNRPALILLKTLGFQLESNSVSKEADQSCYQAKCPLKAISPDWVRIDNKLDK